MYEQRYGIKPGHVLRLRTDEEKSKKERYVVKKLYTNVVLLENNKKVKICPNYAKLKEMMGWHFLAEPKKEKNKTELQRMRKTPLARDMSDKYPKLTKKQVIFCEEYVRTGDGKHALKAAGYDKSSHSKYLKVTSSQDVQDYIKELRQNA